MASNDKFPELHTIDPEAEPGVPVISGRPLSFYQAVAHSDVFSRIEQAFQHNGLTSVDPNAFYSHEAVLKIFDAAFAEVDNWALITSFGEAAGTIMATQWKEATDAPDTADSLVTFLGTLSASGPMNANYVAFHNLEPGTIMQGLSSFDPETGRGVWESRTPYSSFLELGMLNGAIKSFHLNGKAEVDFDALTIKSSQIDSPTVTRFDISLDKPES